MNPKLLMNSMLFVLASITRAVPTFKSPGPYEFIDIDTSLHKRNVGGVRLSDGKNFTGHVWYGIWPLNECVSLNDYIGNLLSFRPDDGNDCMLFQGHCDADEQYGELYYNSSQIGDLSEYSWISNVESYMCFEPV